jgi:transcriptional regulator with XRE-family HTH domain
MDIGYGFFIKTNRIKSGYKSQRVFAVKSGISSATISRIENEIQKPQVATLQIIAPHLTSTTFMDLMTVCGYLKE